LVSLSQELRELDFISDLKNKCIDLFKEVMILIENCSKVNEHHMN
jgi:hypothetical protein